MEKESKIENKFNTQEVPDLKEYLKNEPPLIDKSKSEESSEEGLSQESGSNPSQTQQDVADADSEPAVTGEVTERSEKAAALSEGRASEEDNGWIHQRVGQGRCNCGCNCHPCDAVHQANNCKATLHAA